MKHFFQRKTIAVISVVFVAVLCGCATIPREEDLKDRLRTAAEMYWKLRVEDKYEDTYRMEDEKWLPPFEKYRDRAMAIKRIKITAISVRAASVNGDKGEVDLEWRYLLPQLSAPFHQIIKDEWTFRDGEWRHIFPMR